MAYQTPRRLPSSRPSLSNSYINTASSPNLGLAASAAMARKASLNALTGGSLTSPTSRMGGDGREIEVGDAVDVPGGMHGVCKFVGNVRGKKGMFAGVELSSEFATRGKNDGDVEGIQYFNTVVPGAGIFLPIHRATKRTWPTLNSDSSPPTPTTPSYSSSQYNLQTPSMPKFSQSIGPGARAQSPVFKPKSRPSLPRPESPMRKPPSLIHTPGRVPSLGLASFSKSQVGAPRFTPSPAPGKRTPVNPRTPGPSRPYSRASSRLGSHTSIDEDNEATPTGFSRTNSSQSRPKSSETTEEIRRLTKKLEERDRQLKEQTSSLADMEASLTELQRLLPTDSGSDGYGDSDVSQLRAALREKNEKISMLTAEFDAHRADFRSTIDTLEMASTETERVYEKRIEDLMQEVRELQDRSEDVESVARQLKQLEELVQELEEGLEDARRGEAEARGEVEFLRGEVERGRSELRREREKAAEALKGAGAAMNAPHAPSGSREVEQRDDEIRGLKAIIHSLSSGPGLNPAANNVAPSDNKADAEEFNQLKVHVERLERETDELKGLVDRKAFREEELERELEKARRDAETASDQRNSVISNGLSERTATGDNRNSTRDSKDTVASWRGSPKAHRHQSSRTLEPMMEADVVSSASSSALWCEICETGGHDILNCTAMSNGNQRKSAGAEAESSTATNSKPSINSLADVQKSSAVHEKMSSDASLHPTPLTTMHKPSNPPAAPLPNPYESGPVAGKGESKPDPDKWCALCERDGHDATLCPFEDSF